MKYRKLDSNGDAIYNTQNNFFYDTEAVAQAIKTRLLLLYSEWWEDIEDGLPLFEKIAGSRNIGVATVIIKQRIRTTQNVAAVKNLSINFNNRKLMINCEVTTTFGNTIQIQEGVII